MNQLSDITTIKSVMSRHKVHLSKSLGQNFLVNPDVCPQMAAECGVGKGIGVLEVGPGIGVLTAELAARAEKVVSVELDRHLLPVLSETLAGFSNIKIVYGDILKIDIRQLIADEFDGMEVVVCANLPYYITSPVIMRFLEERLPVSAVTVMVQKEAATRLCALPGTRACGAVSAAVHYYSEPQILFGVDRTSFLPQPKVDSAVIRLDVRKEPCIQINSEKNFFALVKAAFGQRRKTVLNAVSAGLPFTREEVALALDHTEIPQNSRAEQLSMEQLAAFSNELYSDI
jgi:16S rRNA (adenine1518-N6/adenine1519-N6)-dimethyltransferase